MAQSAAMTASSSNANGNEARNFTVFLPIFLSKASSKAGFAASELRFTLPFSTPADSSTFLDFPAERASEGGFFGIATVGFLGLPASSPRCEEQEKEGDARLEMMRKPWR
jgi:hypothetical protein